MISFIVCGEKVNSPININQNSGLMNCPDCGNLVSKKAKSYSNSDVVLSMIMMVLFILN